MSSETVSVVIVHYRTPEETCAAARSVEKTAPAAEILVVDNASGDSISERLSRAAPTARVATEASNRGYGAACNRGARETSGELLLFLNSDARLLRGSVEALMKSLESSPGAAAAGPLLLDPDGTPQPSIQRFPTPWRIFCESSGLASLFGGRVFRGHTKTAEDHGSLHAVETLKGAALLLRRSDFEAAGGFDETFFLYGEETDLIRRLADRCREVLFVPQAEVVHSGGGSGGDALFGLVHEGLRRYVLKHHGPGAARFAAACLWLGATGRYVLALVTPGEGGKRRRLRYRSALKGNRQIPSSGQ
ncbi:MAG TPA: glycosyltransferase family 2 protein [Thermoanaerobaculia bacterium]|nr:glycosyltransferase family 2 protein [Thermoanaerobaculia bacterium]